MFLIKFIFSFFFGIIFLLFLFGFLGIRFLKWKLKRRVNQKREDFVTNNSNFTQSKEKIFEDDEGEYVDFEEIE